MCYCPFSYTPIPIPREPGGWKPSCISSYRYKCRVKQDKTSSAAVCPYLRLSPCSMLPSISALLKLWSLKLNSCIWHQTEKYFNWMCGQLVVDGEVFEGDEWLPLAEIYFYNGERKIVVTFALVLLSVLCSFWHCMTHWDTLYSKVIFTSPVIFTDDFSPT